MPDVKSDLELGTCTSLRDGKPFDGRERVLIAVHGA